MHSSYLCLVTLLKYNKIGVSESEIERLVKNVEEFNELEFMRLGKDLECKIKKVDTLTKEELAKTFSPCMGKDALGEFFLYLGMNQEGHIVIQYVEEASQTLSVDEFMSMWSGDFLYVKKKITIDGVVEQFNLRWFWHSISKYRSIYTEVFVSTFIIQLLGVFSPILFQVMVDKVIPYNSYSTLYVLGGAMLMVYIFEVLMEGLRVYTFSHTNSRIDVELGMKLFNHLTKLPLMFFASRPVGQVIARVQELNTIREFLTSNSITVVLDLLFSFVYFILMFLYSPQLTVIVLISIPLYLGTSLVISPKIKALIEEQFHKGAQSQTFLYETVSGIETVKSMALEKNLKYRWEDKLGDYVKSSFNTAKINNIGVQIIQLIGKLVSLAILIFGAQMVFANTFTLGELIAFNMFATQVSQPIMRLAQLWQDFQQMSVSVERLGDVLNAPTEYVGKSTMRLENLEGNVRLENVDFRYEAGGKLVLEDVSVNIDAGDVVGIVGRSGSGKSTITKLIQKLYVVEKGKVYVDGSDISTLDPIWLRENIGVVLQENFLFNMSIKENISIFKPETLIDDVIKVAKVAGAHEFISEFENGYDTVLEERGSNLSGGQRQRIAIARALLSNPKLLIFDEATSALDYESENIIQKNMEQICAGRTVFIVAHRLSSINHANKIICFDKGKIVEMGSQEELMNKKGLYYYLQSQQEK